MTTEKTPIEIAEEALEEAIPFIGYSAHVPDVVKRAEESLAALRAHKEVGKNLVLDWAGVNAAQQKIMQHSESLFHLGIVVELGQLITMAYAALTPPPAQGDMQRALEADIRLIQGSIGCEFTSREGLDQAMEAFSRIRAALGGKDE